uniref:Uncharacterized protein n=1 Tax=Ornithorhynchus anatinus TaxID=9258 RepID=A0A6I8PFW0_ORNAN
MMVSRDLLKSWHEAVEAVDEKNWESALKIFSAVAEPPSKIDFNVGCLRLSSGNPEGALKAFDRAVAKDSCLAVGFFQRGSGSSPDGEMRSPRPREVTRPKGFEPMTSDSQAGALATEPPASSVSCCTAFSPSA